MYITLLSIFKKKFKKIKIGNYLSIPPSTGMGGGFDAKFDPEGGAFDLN